MAQRYTVFLNDKAVIICRNIDKPENQDNDIVIQYAGRQSIEVVYARFIEAGGCKTLWILAGVDFEIACLEFNSLFKRIEAAGGIVRNHPGEYLFIKRLGVWDLPKGKLHKSELVHEGALREVCEETGLKGLTITKQLPSSFHIYTDRHGRAVLKETYWFEMLCHEPQPLVPQTEEDISEAKWFTKDELSIPILNTYASLQQLWKAYMPE